MHSTRQWAAFAMLVLVVPLLAPTFSVAADTAVPRFEAAPCPWKLDKTQTEGTTARCGYVVTAESHANPGGATIHLAVAIFKSTLKKPLTNPTLYLEGGPGGNPDDLVSAMTPNAATVLAGGSDLVIFDQRGTGLSQPALNCPEVRSQQYDDDAAGVSSEDASTHQVTALMQCRDRLLGLNINLAAYTSAESAADVNDIRAALGYGKVNLLGVSYGTRLALTVMRDYPTIVRSAVLDSSVPLQANIFEDNADNYTRSLNLLFAACAASADCTASHPDMPSEFAAAYTTLSMHPLNVVTNDRMTGKAYTTRLDGDAMVSLVFQLLYDSDALGEVSTLLSEIARGATSDLTRSRTSNINVFRSGSGDGVYWSTYCTEEVPFNHQDRALALVQTAPTYLRPALAQTLRVTFATCAQWPVKAASSIETQPVTSTVPTLVLSSANDPATPPSYGEAVAMTLSNVLLVPFPGVGHSVIFNADSCGAEVSARFLVDPTSKPDTTCIATL